MGEYVTFGTRTSRLTPGQVAAQVNRIACRDLAPVAIQGLYKQL